MIRAFNRQDSEMKRFKEENSLLVKSQIFVGKIAALLNPVTYVIINLAIVILIWTGAKQVDAGVLSQGKVVALVNYMSQILVELIKLANLVILISKAMASMKRVDGIFEIEPDITKEGGTAEKLSPGCQAKEEAYSKAVNPKVRFFPCNFYISGGKRAVFNRYIFYSKSGRNHWNHRRNRFRKVHAG